MGDEQKKQSDQKDELDLTDLTVVEPEIEVISNEDARVIPEVGASILPDFSCTLCSSSSM